MSETRFKNWGWNASRSDGQVHGFDGAQLAVLMDIRDELQTLNRIIGCHNCIAIPDILRGIRANTSLLKPKRKPYTRKESQ